MKNKTENIFHILKKKIVIIIGATLFLLSSIITITQGGSLLHNFFNESFRHKENLYTTLKHLATETNVEYFKSLLGQPIYINDFDDVREYIFVNDLFYVQSITDKNNKVIAYSVTTTAEDFNPEVPLFEGIKLGKSKFTDLNTKENSYNTPNWIISFLGAHDLFYSEGYYLGNPGGYQSVFFSITESGFINYKEYKEPPYYESPTINFPFKRLMGFNLEQPKELSEFRKINTNIINTYSVLGQFVTPNDFLKIRKGSANYYLFGPNYNQVRLLNY